MAELTKDAAEAFIYREVRLLDEWRLDDWQRLFTADGIYWLPMTEAGMPRLDPSILCDDAEQRAMRVHQMTRHDHLAQTPHSRTTHFVSNVELAESDTASNSGAAGDRLVLCNALIFELRPGDFQELRAGMGRQRALAARCRYRLRHSDGWKIAEKRVLLLDRDLPLYNLTFIL